MALHHLLPYLFSLYRLLSSSCAAFDGSSSNIDNVHPLKLSPNQLVSGNFNVHNKDWFTNLLEWYLRHCLTACSLPTSSKGYALHKTCNYPCADWLSQSSWTCERSCIVSLLLLKFVGRLYIYIYVYIYVYIYSRLIYTFIYMAFIPQGLQLY